MALKHVPTDSSNDRQHRTVIATTVNELVKVRPPFDRTVAEVEAGVTPIDTTYGPGQGKRYLKFSDAIKQLEKGGDQVELERGATYTVSAVTTLDDLSNFRINGNGATIKAADGMTVGSGTQLLHLTNCTDFVIENLKFDGNRANRTPAEVSSHLLHLTSCQKFNLRNVRADNATTDGIRLDASDASDHDTYCTDFVIDNCHADNAYRGGMGIINAYDGVVLGGSYTNSNGTSPEYGVDVEPNTSLDPGARSVRFMGVKFTGNSRGLVLASVEGDFGMEVSGCYFSDCSIAGLVAGAPTVVIGCEFDSFTASGAIGIEVSTNPLSKMRCIGSTFREFGSSAGACIDDGSTTTLVEIIGCEFKNVVNCVSSEGDRLNFTHNDVDTTSGIAVSVGSSTAATITHNRILAATGRAILSTSLNNLITHNNCVDVASVSGGYIQAEGAGNVLTHNICEASSAQATTIGIRAHHDATAVAWNKCINLHTTQPYSIQGTESASTAFIGYNVGGTANLAKRIRFAASAPIFSDASRPAANTVPQGAEIWNSTTSSPNFSDGTNWKDAVGTISGSATFDPASLADGAGTTTTVTVTGAALGDFAEASFSLDLQGITVTAWVSAANTVSVRFQNESGGVLDLASGTLRARVRKA